MESLENFFEGKYNLSESAVKVFGKNLIIDPDYIIEHAKETIIAEYSKEFNSDGQDVVVSVQLWPADFYKIVALPGKNSCNESKKGFILETGSGMAELSAQIAEAISEGMLVISEEK